MKGKWSCLVWFALAAVFVKFFALDGALREREIRSWEQYQAIVLSSDVALDSGNNEYELSVEFGVDFGDQKLKYETFRAKGAKGYVDGLAAGSYARGMKIDVFINPDNRMEFAFGASEAGHLWVGYLGGLAFAAIGVSVLWRK